MPRLTHTEERPRPRLNAERASSPELDVLCAALCRTLGVSAALIARFAGDEELIVGAHAIPLHLLNGAERPREGRLATWCSRGEASEARPGVTVNDAVARAYGASACAITPVYDGANSVIGAFLVLSDRAREWQATERELLQEWSAAIALQLSLQDTLSERRAEARLYHTIVSNMPGTAVLLFDRELFYRVAEGCELFKTAGASQAELVGRSMLEVIAEEERPHVEQLYRATLEGHSGRMEMRRKNNWYAVHTLPLRDSAGTVTHGMLCAYNITDFKAAKAELSEKTRLLGSILDNMSEGLIVADVAGQPILFNPAGERILGLDGDVEDADSAAEQGLFLADGETLVAPQDIPLTRALAGEHVEQMELFARTPEAPAGRWYSVNANPLLDPQGKRLGGICVVRDVTLAKQAEFALREQTAFVELLQKITLSANAAKSSREAQELCLTLVCAHMNWPIGHVYTYDTSQRELLPTDSWRLDDANLRRAFCEATVKTRLLRGQGLPGRVLESGRAEWVENMSQASPDARTEAALAVGLRASFAFPVLVGAEVVAVLEFFDDAPGQPHQRLLEIMENVGVQLGRAVERERHIEAIEALSLTDELTGLGNRRGFLEHARRQLKILRRQRRPALLFFADLDGLKQINDVLGHEMGDAAIKEAAEVLRQSFRDTDVIARFGGDEFVVLVAETDRAVSVRMMERIEANLRRANRAEGRAFNLAMSVGVSVYDPEEPLPLEELLARADSAMYQQKQLRRAEKASTPAS